MDVILCPALAPPSSDVAGAGGVAREELGRPAPGHDRGAPGEHEPDRAHGGGARVEAEGGRARARDVPPASATPIRNAVLQPA